MRCVVSSCGKTPCSTRKMTWPYWLSLIIMVRFCFVPADNLYITAILKGAYFLSVLQPPRPSPVSQSVDDGLCQRGGGHRLINEVFHEDTGLFWAVQLIPGRAMYVRYRTLSKAGNFDSWFELLFIDWTIHGKHNVKNDFMNAWFLQFDFDSDEFVERLVTRAIFQADITCIARRRICLLRGSSRLSVTMMLN